MDDERTFDWQGVQQRVAAAEVALAGLDETSPAVLEQVWARRAAQLAQVPVQDDEDERVELVLIQLGRELYGLEVQYIFDIKPVEQITRVPRVPEWVSGVVNLRGRIFSVLDLRRFFGLAQGDAGPADSAGLSYLVVVETPDMEVALLADDVLNVEALPARYVQEATGTVRGLRPEYVRGVTERRNGRAARSTATDDDGDLLVVLDLPALLSDERLIIHEEIV
jgi:purine-binding chemotaxis protein CheW